MQSGDDYAASFCGEFVAIMHFRMVLGVDVIRGGGGCTYFAPPSPVQIQKKIKKIKKNKKIILFAVLYKKKI